MKVLITGSAGFIGSHVSHRLLDRGNDVIGIDNLNDYYDPGLKKDRLSRLVQKDGFTFHKIDIADKNALETVFKSRKISHVINLAAQPGVRYSLQNPDIYVKTNVNGFMNVLEACRHHDIKHLVYASSSSVYGANTRIPFSVSHSVDHPISIYAATKKSNELMAHTYAHLFRLPVTGLRFFTVYGPWGRPDMAIFKFTKRIIEGMPIDVYNDGNHSRDFTYIDDIATGVVKCLDNIASPNPAWDSDKPDVATSNAPYRLFNIGNNKPVDLMYFINCIEKAVGKSAKINFLPLQLGDVPKTFADISALENTMGYKADTNIESGVIKFVKWYRDYYDA